MKKIRALFLITLVALFLASCASTPKAEDVDEEPEVVETQEAEDDVVEVTQTDEVTQTVEPKSTNIEDDTKNEILRKIASVTYIVKYGDNLYKLAIDSDLYVWQIADLNYIDNPALILENQALEIPDSKQDPNRYQGDYYKIDIGDTLYELAQMLGTTIEDLQAINDISDVNQIKAGTLIKTAR